MPRVYYSKCPIQQADAAIDQAPPTTTTLYEVLPTTKNAKILCIGASVTWAVTQPTPLDIVVTVDGRSRVFSVGNPVSGTEYMPSIGYSTNAEDNEGMGGMPIVAANQAAFEACSGRSVRVQVRTTITGGTTHLICRVKWMKLP